MIFVQFLGVVIAQYLGFWKDCYIVNGFMSRDAAWHST